jgi:hypothetical protein
VLFLVFGFMSCEIVLLHLKAIFTLVCLKRCDFSDVWGYVCESRPFGVGSGFCKWRSLGYFLLCLLFQSDYKVFWEGVLLGQVM